MLDICVRQILLTVLCILEVWMCFRTACLVLKGERILTKMQRTGIVLGSLVIGLALGYNRNLLFFSDGIWILIMACVGIWTCVLIRYRLVLVVETVVLYLSAVALLDFFFSFLCMSYLRESFWYQVYYRTISWWTILIFICTRGVVFGIFLYINKHLSSGSDMVSFWKILLPVCIIMCVLVRFFRILLLVIAESVFDIRAWSVGIALLSCLILLLFFVLFLQKSGALQDENKVLRVRDDLQKRRYQELEEQHGESRRVIHDIRNHIMLLQGLCEKQDLSGISGYLKEMAGMFQASTSNRWTNNDILNIILNQKLQEAQNADIKMKIQSIGYLRMPFDESEMVSLFGNLLDNAIEACRKVQSRERLIEIRIDQKQDMIYLKVINSVEEEPVIKNNHIVSTKRDKKAHGYGLKNIRRIVDKYDGVMVMETSDYKFYIYISFFMTVGEEE